MNETGLQQYLAQTTVVIEENTLRYNEAHASQIVEGLHKVSDLGNFPVLKSRLMQAFKNAVVHLKEPDFEVSRPHADMSKHFMMVSPHKTLFFDLKEEELLSWPKENLKNWAKWEGLRRAVEFSGAKVTVQNASDENSPEYISCRDSYAMVGNIVYRPDPVSPGGKNHRAHGEAYPCLLQRLEGGGRLAKFFKTENQQVEIVKGTWFDGGNVIVHPQSKTVFFGMNSYEAAEINYLIDAKVLETTLNVTQESVWTVFPVPLKEVNINIIESVVSASPQSPPHFIIWIWVCRSRWPMVRF